MTSGLIHRDRPRPPAREMELLDRAQKGDVAAFEELAGTHVNRVFLATLRLLGDRGEAEDVVQETLLRAWRGIRGCGRRSCFSTWLYGIAVDEASRSLNNVARSSETIRLPGEQQHVSSLPDHDAARESGCHELRAALRTALLALPLPYRIPVVLRDIEGLSTREAAEIAGVGEAAFKSRLHQGRLQIRAMLGDQTLITVAS